MNNQVYLAFRDLYRKKGYMFFKGLYNVNIFGIRSLSSKPNSFDDYIGILYQNEIRNMCMIMNATVDAGVTVLGDTFGGENGTLILPLGQHRGLFKKGKHRGRYDALVQAREVEVIRDTNKDSLLTYNSGFRETGWFGLNLHRANKNFVTRYVNDWSHGCSVIQDVFLYDWFMNIITKSLQYYKNSFTYTLFSEADVCSAGYFGVLGDLFEFSGTNF